MKSDLSKRMVENSGKARTFIHSFSDTFKGTCYVPGIKLDKGDLKMNREHS